MTLHHRIALALALSLPLAAGCQATITEADDQDTSSGDPGRVTLHRLNNTEYNNTVRDLLGTSLTPADDFTPDDQSYGFDNIADVLSISPLQTELYQRAAEKLAAEVMIGVFARTLAQAEETGGDTGHTVKNGTAWGLFLPGAVIANVTVEDAGEQHITVRAWARQGGPDLAHMEIRVDGTAVGGFDVAATAESPQEYTVAVDLPAGPVTIAAAFTNDFHRPENNVDRNLFIDWIELAGPPQTTAAKEQIMSCEPTPETALDCAKQIIGDFALRAWRRPPTAEEVAGLATLIDVAVTENQTFEQGIQLAIETILSSPHFIYRVEIDDDPASKTSHPLSGYELASRLSYFLWSSMPDQELFDLAAAGTLQRTDVLSAQIDRMLADPKAAALIENFAAQWLFLRGMSDHTTDPEIYPAFGPALKKLMVKETKLYFREFLFGGVGMDEFLSADFTYLNAELAAHYGIPFDGGADFERVSLAGTNRAGFLTQGSFLTVTSYPNRTSPVRRGKWVLEQVLCAPPPPPPPGVEGIEDNGDIDGVTIRERMEQHRIDPECRSCHEAMDPIGFALEKFDGVGAFREVYNIDGQTYEIDASGTLPGGDRFEGARELGQILSRDLRFPQCLTEKMYTYALGRGPEPLDERYLYDISVAFIDSGYDLKTLIHAIAESRPFRYRRGGEQ